MYNNVTPLVQKEDITSPPPAPSSPAPRAVNVETQNFASLRHCTAVGVKGDGGEADDGGWINTLEMAS